MKVTFNIPEEAAETLAHLAQTDHHSLRELGILSIQVQGGQVIAIDMSGKDDVNEPEKLEGEFKSTISHPVQSMENEATKAKDGSQTEEFGKSDPILVDNKPETMKMVPVVKIKKIRTDFFVNEETTKTSRQESLTIVPTSSRPTSSASSVTSSSRSASSVTHSSSSVASRRYSTLLHVK